MEKGLRLRLSGLAAKFMEEMKKQGLTEEDVLAQALGLMADVWRTKAVAKIKERYSNADHEIIEFYYAIQTPEGFKPREDMNGAKDTETSPPSTPKSPITEVATAEKESENQEVPESWAEQTKE